MKNKYFILIILLWCIVNNSSAQIKAQVKESFELTSIVFRLAGAKEYTNNVIPIYTADIDNYFAKHKEHKLITYIKEIREKQGIAYDAIPAATGCIDIKGGKVVIDPKCDPSQINQTDKRWTEQSFKTFVHLLNDFYKQTRFKDFFIQHIDLYNIAENRLNAILATVNVEWFKSMFGEGPENITIAASLCNGPSNYAFKGTMKEKRGIVIGCSVDKDGNPAYNRLLIITIVHEILHHYTNPYIIQYWSQIDSASQKIYPHVKEKMAKLAYGNANSTMIEWFNNLLTIMYLKDNPNKSLTSTHLTSRMQHTGFIWMERAMIFMEHFYKHRDLYPTIEKYMPEIVGFINYTASDFENVLKEFDNREPYVKDIFPTPNSILPTGIDTIYIRFPEPMFIGAHGTRPLENKDIQIIPLSQSPFWKDEYTFCIILDRSKLEKGKTYGFKLSHNFFQSKKTFPMKEDYPYTFKMPDK